MADDELDIWTICKHPSDYPDKYTARRHVITSTGRLVATDDLLLENTIEPLREALRRRGLVYIGRMAEDDPVILESWV